MIYLLHPPIIFSSYDSKKALVVSQVNSGCDLYSHSVVPAALKLDATKQKQKTTNRRDEGGRHAIHHLYSLPYKKPKTKTYTL
jgi:hypothetical protein